MSAFDSPTRLNLLPLLLVILGSFAWSATAALADHWSQFRGSDANAVSPNPLPVTWSDDDGQTQNIRWKVAATGAMI